MIKTQGDSPYRHEYKYIISAGMMAVLRSRIAGVLPSDAHAGSRGSYTVRSLYFDDYADTCYYENENGTDPREKFRIRIYNGSDAVIALECKRKEREKTMKTSCRLTRQEAELLMSGSPLPDFAGHPAVLRRFLLFLLQRQMHPTTIVEYERYPYTYAPGNVRITFDTHLVSSTDFGSFFDSQLERRPVMPTGFHLMEVKYDEFLPSFIYNCLELDGVERTAFSKYYLCRKYGL